MCNGETLLAILIILVLVVMYFRWQSNSHERTPYRPNDMLARLPNVDNSCRTLPCLQTRGRVNAQREIDMMRGHYNDQRAHYSGINAFNPVTSNLTPEMYTEAERGAWYAAINKDGTGRFNTENSAEIGDDAMQYHTNEPNMDYNGYVTDLVVDPRTKKNHDEWVNEIMPWSGTAMTVDNMDEAMEASINFTGLRRPQPVAQYNPMFVTELDATYLASNPKFNFRG